MTLRISPDSSWSNVSTREFYEGLPDLGFCIFWPGHITPKGYGTFTLHRKMTLVHRYVYLLYHPDASPDITVDHLCGNKSCFYLYHLEGISRKENKRRARVRSRCAKHGDTREWYGNRWRCRRCLRESISSRVR